MQTTTSNSLEATRLKERMAGLINKWKDKETPEGSTDWYYRRGDKTLYRALKKKLNKLSGTEDIVDEARDIFGKKTSP